MLVHAHAQWTADAAAHGNGCALRRNFQRPPSKQFVRRVGLRKAKCDPKIALVVELRTDGELMVIVEAPNVTKRVKPVGPSVTVGVRDAGDFGLLRDVESFRWLLERPASC